MSVDQALGEKAAALLSAGTITYRERGDGPPVVFVHGFLTNGDLWRSVVPEVADAGYRCLTPDWPLGSHRRALPDADLSPPGIAALVIEFLDHMDLSDVTLVGNDTGGAIVQMVMASMPQRVGRVVLTSCDALERFPTPLIAALPVLARIPGAVEIMVALLRWRSVQRLPIAYGWLSRRPAPAAIMDSYLAPARVDAQVRADLRRALRGMHRRHTLRAARSLPTFAQPVLLVWAAEDRLFPLDLARRLARLLPDVKLVTVADSYTHLPEDQPAALAAAIVDFGPATSIVR